MELAIVTRDRIIPQYPVKTIWDEPWLGNKIKEYSMNKQGICIKNLNFAWNGRFKTMREADAQFARNEKFPHPREKCDWFAKFWPKSLL